MKVDQLKARALAIPTPSSFVQKKKDSNSHLTMKESPAGRTSSVGKVLGLRSYVQDVSRLSKRDISSSDIRSAVKASAQKDGRKKIEAEVIVFNDASAASSSTLDATSSYEKRAFMSSDVSKVFNDGLKKVSTKEEAQDKEDDKNDKELMDLLKSSRLLEDFAASELTGKDRREYLEKKITEIGGKDLKKQKAAPPIRVGIIKAEKGRAQKRLQMAKDMGLYHSSLRSQILNGDEKPVQKKKVNKRSNRELTGSTGTFSGGVLHVPKSVIKSTNAAPKAFKRGKGKGAFLSLEGGAGPRPGKKPKSSKGKKKR